MRFDSCASEYDSHATPQRAFAERVARFIRDPSGPGNIEGLGRLRSRQTLHGNLPREMGKTRPHHSPDSSTNGTETHLPSEAIILELGAGTGALTRWLCELPGARVCATDASSAMVSIGKSAVPRAEWKTLDAFRYPLMLSVLQVSSGLLQWAPDPVAVLRHWKAALCPGGRMVHAFACEPCLQEWRKVASESPVTWRDEAGWLVMFEEAGLRVQRKKVWLECIEFHTSLQLARSLHGSGVTGHPRMGAGQLREAMRHYDRLFRSENGVFSTWAWMAVEATPA